MTIHKLSEFLEKIELEASRNELTTLLSFFYKEFESEDEIMYFMYFLNARLAPTFVDLEFNFSSKLVFQALEALIVNLGIEFNLKDTYKRTGDLGLTCMELHNFLKDTKSINQSLFGTTYQFSDKNYSISDIYKKLLELAKASGKGSAQVKLDSFIETFLEVDSLSIKFITRIVTGDLRLGVSNKTILDSLSWFISSDKSNRELLDKAFGARADTGELAKIVVFSKPSEVIEKLSSIKLKVGFPVASKLVERESDYEAVWERMPNCFVQPKLDGLRGQLHYSKLGLSDILGKTAIFSRNMENMTEQFPDLSESLESLGVDSIILDSEIVGFDEKNDSYLTYQETMQRKRKYDISEYQASIPVRAMCFDILYLNGEDLSDKPIEERLKILDQILNNTRSSDFKTLKMLETLQVNTALELEDYFETQVGSGLEGIITKATGTNYEPGTRNFKWIKLKANTKSDLVDNIDVAIIGYYIGRGQRAKSGVGALLAAVYDEKEDKYYSVGKVGSGFTDEVLEKVAKDIQPLVVKEKPENFVVEKMLYPDFWLEPKIVSEIIADEITRSPAHTAAIGIKTLVKKDNPEKGLSVRFPRLKIWKRDKNTPNTVSELVRMYELRKTK